MALTEPRQSYRPFEYDRAYEFYRKQQLVHWIKDEIKIAEDLTNWKNDLTETEREVVGGILRGFTQMETTVGDYWRKVPNWFPKPEIAMMCSTFSYFESIHADSYALINESLGLDDFTAFLYDEDTKQKLDYFVDIPDQSTLAEKAKSLAIFSAFAEGCLLFSSFAVLLSFQRENLLKGVGQIVSYSIRDENCHSEGGCWLFNQMCAENDGLRDSIRLDIEEAANTCYQLEKRFVDNLFNDNSIRTLNPFDLKQFIKHRINMKLNEIGYGAIFEVDPDSITRMSWFDSLSGGREFGDFFVNRNVEYSHTSYKTDDLF